MHIEKVIESLRPILVVANLDGNMNHGISDIVNNSSQVRPNCLFVCHRGRKFDSHEIAQEIYNKGASLLVSERPLNGSIPHLIVSDTRLAEAMLADAFFEKPYKKLLTIGVTGTNGKTTSVHLFHHVLQSFSSRGSLLGTVHYEILGEPKFHHDNTTPGAIEILRAMRKTVDKAGSHFVMEVSSHALSLKRVETVRFDIAALTNITRDHLDFHQTFEEYTQTKLHIFDLLKENGIALISDEYSHLLNKKVRKIVYGISRQSHYRIQNLEVSKRGTRFEIECPAGKYKLWIRIPGYHNAMNATLVFAGLVELGYDPNDVAASIASFQGVDGRFQFIPEASLLGIDVVVDFAHSPDALEKTLVTARHLTSGRIITVFGAGGQADKGKRPMMAQIVCRYSDVAIITTDDPRGEDPIEILNEVESGVPSGAAYLVIPDRREAIETAITLANRGDMVVIAGRGHEEYQIFSDERKIPFKDADVAREIIVQEYQRERRHV
ncbi:UDP-N-acetylmuramoyl-L-alanyl-D-glutamate--LD-lysine ligase [Pseudothermotoga hypogea DSM 11164 = NBRC 106472]|uniref:UDP-N-acetylmuramyl-tripeptide synthetase n=1 Tax=Pseudothermotoga hypogea DSM 11164 = NBRC 106472 TaxID=1123384 RepID=A0A0X1KQ65_9THEM|nr:MULTISPECIES: UDP-N-acetylmuramoyl-L-alanyl-D-glutamate--2,6-diaminopimelate ligase [Pseudothermotoga]AJC73359.1 UDP-N-acetylmuramoyl-L-alanyl-D-glutamate--LD-lysine ligase [Pseudothermotoga hypogea DSM 11164 = NBRC 106472]MDI6862935.1 UDP-N-acetylmuramoyl-L-alanyl-D-glutamate--2,6-diaminopimelate ligase [Pseudothermotoga sp.]